MNKIYKGEDKTISLTVKDNGVAVDLDATYNGILCYLYYYTGDVLAKYSKETLTGFDSLTVTDSANGVFQVKLQSAVTKTAKKGDVYAEIKTQATDVLYDSSSFHSIVDGIEIGTIEDSNSKNVADFD